MGFLGLGGSGSDGSGYMGAAGGILGGVGTNIGNLNGLAGQGNTGFGQFYAPWLQSQGNIANYYQNLAQNGLNSKQQASFLGQFGDYTNPYTQASSNAAASNAQRGFGALGGGGNSVSGSADDYIGAQQANNLQSRLSQMGQYQLQQTPQWLQQAAQAQFAPVQFGSQLAQSGWGQAGNMGLQQAQQYAGLAQQQYQQEMQKQQMLGQGLGSILGAGTSLLGMGMYSKMLGGMMGQGQGGGGQSGGMGGGAQQQPTLQQLISGQW